MKGESRNIPVAPVHRGWRRWISFGGLVELMNGMSSAWIFVMLALINLDIIGRTIFNHPVRGVNEIVGMTIVACIFLQLAHGIRKDRLTRSDIILSRLDRMPRLRLALEASYDLVGTFLLAILFFFSIPILTHAWNIDEYVGAEGSFTAPIWPVKLIVVVGCLVSTIQCLINSYRRFRKMKADELSDSGTSL